jgi:phenylalanyl-tRNA synthetase beta chain
MYISYHWLKDYLKLPAKLSPEEIASQLTNHTVEVEGVSRQAEQFAKVVVGQVLSVDKHPNADRLRLVVVDVKKKRLNIVCGAPNLAVGQLVPVALVGAVLPNGLEIKESLIRGEKSSGMICAEDELGLGKNHDGILVLSANAKVGEELAKYLKADDVVFEVDNKSLSNRPDLLCHYGLARELAAIFDVAFKPLDKVMGKVDLLGDQKKTWDVKVEDTELCPRYSGIKLTNLVVKESPDWLKQRLIAIGQRPINNIVDLTNYVMFDVGQPLHAFDAAQIDKLVVRRANKQEMVETLDNKERFLDDNDLVISDRSGILAIAGLMGGASSEVSATTTEIILEAANFKAAAIRKTGQKLNLRTEASSRFEKSLDPSLTELAIKRFISLLKDVCPEFKISGGLVDINNVPAKVVEIALDLNWLSAKIGQEMPREQVISIFDKLGFKVQDRKAEILQITVPSWRATKDINIKEDLVEEVLRLYGYDNVESKMPIEVLTIPEINQERLLERKVKNILALKYALSEVYNYSFLGEDQLKKAQIDFFNYLRLANPLSEVQSLLRQSLVSGLINNIKLNQARGTDLGFFEIGQVFFSSPGHLQKDHGGEAVLPHQEKHLGLAMSGDQSSALFSQIKGVISGFLKNISNYESEITFSVLDNKPGWADSRVTAKIIFLQQEIGQVAIVDQTVAANFNLKKSIALAEINFSLLANLIAQLPPFSFQEMARYPVLTRDIAFVVEDKIMYNDLRQALINFHPLLKKVELFDVYIGNHLPEGQKSLAFHLYYQSEERTLTATEVDKIQQELVIYLDQNFGAKLRDF